MNTKADRALRLVALYKDKPYAKLGLSPSGYAAIFLEFSGVQTSITEIIDLGQRHYSKIRNLLNLEHSSEEFKAEAERIRAEKARDLETTSLEDSIDPEVAKEIEKLNNILHRYPELQGANKSTVGQCHRMPKDVLQAVSKLSDSAYNVFLQQYFSKEQILSAWLLRQPGYSDAATSKPYVYFRLPRQAEYKIALDKITKGFAVVPKPVQDPQPIKVGLG